MYGAKSESRTAAVSAGNAAPNGLRPWERRGVIAFAIVLFAFGGMVELRSAFLQRRKGDLGVFLRAAWAVRADQDLYKITDDNGFHYCYPPLLAVLLTPLADPPADADRSGMLPYAVSVGICYVLNLVFLGVAVHTLARALQGPNGPPPGSRDWWTLRLWPVLACLIPLGHTLMRGQVNLLLLALLCASVAAVVRGRSFRAGVWLALAISLKIIPAFLLIFPAWRRDRRFLGGCAAGLAVGLVAVPVAALGPARTVACYRSLAAGLIGPGLGMGGDDSLAGELTDVKSTDSQSVLAVIHNVLHPDFATRPAKASAGVRLASYVICGALTLVTLLAAGRRRTGDALATVLLWGTLILDMLLLSPVCHLHYFSLCTVMAMALIAARRERAATPGPGLVALFAYGIVTGLLPVLPGGDRIRDFGVATTGAFALWLVCVVVLWRRVRRAAPEGATHVPLGAAA